MFKRLSITATVLAMSAAPAFAGGGGSESAPTVFIFQAIVNLITKFIDAF